jgi:hypothetical protein
MRYAKGPVYLPPYDIPPLIDRAQQAADAWAGAGLACVWLLVLTAFVASTPVIQ